MNGQVDRDGRAEAVPELLRFCYSADPAVLKNAAYALRFSTIYRSPNSFAIRNKAISGQRSESDVVQSCLQTRNEYRLNFPPGDLSRSALEARTLRR
jgi:hypothetical protein